jgi:hypothetical protein
MHHNANRIRIAIQKSALYYLITGYKYAQITHLSGINNIVEHITHNIPIFQAKWFYDTHFK